MRGYWTVDGLFMCNDRRWIISDEYAWRPEGLEAWRLGASGNGHLASAYRVLILVSLDWIAGVG